MRGKWLLLVLWFGSFTGVTCAAEEPSPTAIEFFEKRVRPILVEHCHKCHGEKQQKGGLRLDSIAKATLGTTKTADGLQSVLWYRNGELDKVAEYCKADVDITRRVYEFGRENGFVYYYSRLGSKLKVAVNWR